MRGQRQERRVAALQIHSLESLGVARFPGRYSHFARLSVAAGQHQVIASVTAKVSSNTNAYGYYVYGKATSDTDGPGTQTSHPYNLRSEYGRAAYDNRDRGFIGASVNLPFRIRLAPFPYLQSGRPYNVASGVEANNGDDLNDDRPAFAQDLSRPSVVRKRPPHFLSDGVRQPSWSFGESANPKTKPAGLGMAPLSFSQPCESAPQPLFFEQPLNYIEQALDIH